MDEVSPRTNTNWSGTTPRSSRSRGIANAALLVVASFVLGTTAVNLNNWYEGRDFHCFWVAGRIVATGGDPYDARQYVPAIATIPPNESTALLRCGQRLSYPPWTALALAPFGALSLAAAAALWASLTLMAAVIGIRWTWQLAGRGRFSWPLVALLVVTTEPFARAFAEGQFGTLVFALTAGAALSLVSNKDRAGGIHTAALGVKPHTAVGFAAGVLGLALLRRRWRFVGTAVVVALGGSALTQVLRPGWLLEFFGGAVELSASLWERATVWNLAGSWPLAVVVIALLLAVVVVLLRSQRLDDADILGLAVAFSLVITPYAWSHDYVVLAIPWSLTVGHARALRWLPRSALTMSTVIVAAPVPWVLSIIAAGRGTASLSVLVPMTTALLLALAIRWNSSRRPQTTHTISSAS
jgi:Glycosyltransferase family 87